VDEMEVDAELKARLWSYMEFAAASMVNQPK
jgi:truncated hemoglobin YjbI